MASWLKKPDSLPIAGCFVIDQATGSLADFDLSPFFSARIRPSCANAIECAYNNQSLLKFVTGFCSGMESFEPKEILRFREMKIFFFKIGNWCTVRGHHTPHGVAKDYFFAPLVEKTH
jgi:hypothetical protein